jgi:hypothetical protein
MHVLDLLNRVAHAGGHVVTTNSYFATPHRSTAYEPLRIVVPRVDAVHTDVIALAHDFIVADGGFSELGFQPVAPMTVRIVADSTTLAFVTFVDAKAASAMAVLFPLVTVGVVVPSWAPPLCVAIAGWAELQHRLNAASNDAEALDGSRVFGAVESRLMLQKVEDLKSIGATSTLPAPLLQWEYDASYKAAPDAKNAALEETVNALNAKLQAASDTVSALAAEMAACKKSTSDSVSALKAKTKALAAELASCTTAYKAAQRQAGTAEGALAVVQAETTMALAEATKRYESAQGSVLKMKAELDKAQAALAAKDASIATRDKTLDSMTRKLKTVISDGQRRDVATERHSRLHSNLVSVAVQHIHSEAEVAALTSRTVATLMADLCKIATEQKEYVSEVMRAAMGTVTEVMNAVEQVLTTLADRDKYGFESLRTCLPLLGIHEREPVGMSLLVLLMRAGREYVKPDITEHDLACMRREFTSVLCLMRSAVVVYDTGVQNSLQKVMALCQSARETMCSKVCAHAIKTKDYIVVLDYAARLQQTLSIQFAKSVTIMRNAKELKQLLESNLLECALKMMSE